MTEAISNDPESREKWLIHFRDSEYSEIKVTLFGAEKLVNAILRIEVPGLKPVILPLIDSRTISRLRGGE